MVLFGGVSCKKYLNITPDNIATLESAFSNSNEAEAYLLGGCYSTLQSFGNGMILNPGFANSFEITFPYGIQRSQLTGDLNATAFDMISGTQNSTNPQLDFWGGTASGVNIWQAIRRCNTFLDNIDLPKDLEEMDKKRWIAEATFLKAYYHYWLIRLYGPIIIEDKAEPINATLEQVRKERQPVDSCFRYVVNLLDKAIVDLPPVIGEAGTEAGRISATIALAVKAEVLATAASPLFNGNPDYIPMKGKRGENLFPAADPSKWQKAAEACKAAIDAANASGAALYQFVPTGNIVHMTDSTKRLLTLQGAFQAGWNTEQIWSVNLPSTSIIQQMASPKLTTEARGLQNMAAVYSMFSVPMAQAELFYSSHGVPINEDVTWDYTNRYTTQPGDSAHQFYIKQGYTTAKCNFYREPRYYADLSFDGGIFFGGGNTDDRNPYYMKAISGDVSSLLSADRYNNGYLPKKLVSYQTVFANTTQVQQYYAWPFMRLPGLWLLYAECLNEVNGPGAEVYDYLNRVRARAGFPDGVVADWAQYSSNPSKPTTKEGLRQIIHQERRIELAFEGQAGWDLKRWKELQSVMSVPEMGWTTTGASVAEYYQLKRYIQPQFGLRNYFFPLSYDVMLKNPNLVQTLYW